jgi:uncharacterized Zn finger protein
MNAINKVCNKCKKELPSEVFATGVKDECYKQCERCRLRGRAENARARTRKKSRVSMIVISDSEDSDMMPQAKMKKEFDDVKLELETTNPLVRLYFTICSRVLK